MIHKNNSYLNSLQNLLVSPRFNQLRDIRKKGSYMDCFQRDFVFPFNLKQTCFNLNELELRQKTEPPPPHLLLSENREIQTHKVLTPFKN